MIILRSLDFICLTRKLSTYSTVLSFSLLNISIHWLPATQSSIVLINTISIWRVPRITSNWSNLSVHCYCTCLAVFKTGWSAIIAEVWSRFRWLVNITINFMEWCTSDGEITDLFKIGRRTLALASLNEFGKLSE